MERGTAVLYRMTLLVLIRGAKIDSLVRSGFKPVLLENIGKILM